MLQLQNISKSYVSLLAVDNLSLQIKPGEIFGLLGPNGAGKTTVVHISVGLLAPDQGTVELKEIGSPLRKNVRRKIGVAPQNLAIYEELTGRENVHFFGRMHGLSGKKLAERSRYVLDLVDLSSRSGDRVKTYSGGMKRRLNLAIALIHNPALLLLDEPTVDVDPQSRNAIFQKIEALRSDGSMVVYTTHYMEEAQRLCDRVGIIDHGKLLALNTVENLIQTYGGKKRLIVEHNSETIEIETDEPMKELSLWQTKGEIKRFRVDTPNLESVFLNLTGRHLRD